MTLFNLDKAIKTVDVDNEVLQTGNHVKTAGGIWVPQAGTDDGATKTSLTGSNVDVLGQERFTEVTAGSTFTLLSEESRLEYKSLRATLRWSSSTNSYFRFRFFGSSNTLIRTDTEEAAVTSTLYSNVDAKTDRYRVEVINSSEEDVQITASTILGVK